MSETQITGGLHAVLRHGFIYRIVQWIFGETRSKQFLIDRYVKPYTDGCSLLDMGCGPGNLVDFLPAGVSYFGFDPSEDYIQRARSEYSDRPNTVFAAGTTSDSSVQQLVSPSSIDVVLIHGVLHHVTDEDAEAMFELAQGVLKPNGMMVILEPAWWDEQEAVRKWVMARDRGKNIKWESDWKNLFDRLTRGWAEFSFYRAQNLIRFYDLLIFEIRRV